MLSSPGQFSLDEAVIKCLLLFLENSPLRMGTAVIGMLLQDIHTCKILFHMEHKTWEGHSVSLLRAELCGEEIF